MNWKNLLIGVTISLMLILDSSGAAIAGKKPFEPTLGQYRTQVENF